MRAMNDVRMCEHYCLVSSCRSAQVCLRCERLGVLAGDVQAQRATDDFMLVTSDDSGSGYSSADEDSDTATTNTSDAHADASAASTSEGTAQDLEAHLQPSKSNATALVEDNTGSSTGDSIAATQATLESFDFETEPAKDDLSAVHIRFTLPNNTRLQHRFRKLDPVAILGAFVESHGYLRTHHELIYSFPSKSLSDLPDQNVSIASLGFTRESIHVKAKA